MSKIDRMEHLRQVLDDEVPGNKFDIALEWHDLVGEVDDGMMVKALASLKALVEVDPLQSDEFDHHCHYCRATEEDYDEPVTHRDDCVWKAAQAFVASIDG